MLKDAARFDRAAERDLIGELEIASYGQAARKTTDRYARRLDETRKIARGRLPFDIRVGRQNDFADRRVAQTSHELGDMKIVWADALERRERSPKNMVMPRKRARTFDGRNIARFGHHANTASITLGRCAYIAEFVLRIIETLRAEVNGILDLRNSVRQTDGVGLRTVKDPISDALSGFRADARKPLELIKKILYCRSCVHRLT